MRGDDVRRVLDAIGARYALIGAHAMAARGYPRFTVDVDFLTTDARVLEAATWSALEREGARVDRRRGDADDPLGGVVHIHLPDDSEVDVIVAKWRWEAGVLERAEPMRIADADILVPRTSDLILLKLAAGGHLDLHDAAVLLSLEDREVIVRQVEEHLPDVTPDIRQAWNDLLAGNGE